jgi:disulfide bond formation protein DsbB
VVIAGLTVLGALYLSFAEGKSPCPLCFYQRAFAMGVFAVLLAGLLIGVNARISLATLALPLAFAGLGVALWHVNLERKGAMECPSGVFGISSAPAQSMAAFGLLCAVLLLDSYQAGRLGNGFKPVAGAAVLGLGLAFLCCPKAANKQPPYFKTPPEAYEEAPKICRPPNPDKG